MKKFLFIILSFYFLSSCKISKVNYDFDDETGFSVKKEFDITIPKDHDTSNYAEAYFKKYYKAEEGKDYIYGLKNFKNLQELSKGKFIPGKSYTVKIFTVPRETTERELRKLIKKQKAQTFGFEGLLLIFDQKREELYFKVPFLSLGPLPIEDPEYDRFSPSLRESKKGKVLSGNISFRRIFTKYPCMILLFFPKD
ncbi:MAG: hypothetical protein KBD12_02375 [Candidatus Pacebacteria bacterium]|nr:hypothetical protein [Candidatus Paceibacterota bacterium]